MRILAVIAACAPAATGQLTLQDAVHEASGSPMRVGTFRVHEDREAGEGRRINLDVIVLPALSETPRPDPVFVFVGGPGQHAPSTHGQWAVHWLRDDRDIVLLGQRGTGGDNALRCAQGGSAQDYLDDLFDIEAYRACLADLSERFDLTKYGTHLAIDDAEDLRVALGYDRINLFGGSYGTRAEHVYLRRHPDSVRAAVMNGVAPIEFINPLYHARGAQNAIDLIFEECAGDPACHARFGDLHAKLDAILQRLRTAPAAATVQDPATGEAVEVMLSESAFAGGLRVLMYWDSRRVPLMVDRAFAGDFDLVAQAALASNAGVRNSLAMGMLLCVTCAEDLSQIDAGMIDAATEGTFTGRGRVDAQLAVCEFWPTSDLPPDYAEPVLSDVPVLLLSGTLDPVTPPVWGEIASRNFSRSTHVVAPGGHGVGGPCIRSIIEAFLDAPGPVDAGCVEGMSLGVFELGRN